MISPVSATGGSTEVIIATFLGFAIATVLSLAVAYKTLQGYRRSGERARLYLAVGLILLTAVPILLQFILTNFGISTIKRSLATTISQLLGLLSMLYSIYGSPQSRQELDDQNEYTQSDWTEK